MTGLRLRVYRAWQKFGPGTTREVASRSAIDILTFRPRTTELFELGFVELMPDKTRARGEASSHEGIYRSLPWTDVQLRFEEKRRGAQTFQPELALGRLAQSQPVR